MVTFLNFYGTFRKLLGAVKVLTFWKLRESRKMPKSNIFWVLNAGGEVGAIIQGPAGAATDMPCSLWFFIDFCWQSLILNDFQSFSWFPWFFEWVLLIFTSFQWLSMAFDNFICFIDCRAFTKGVSLVFNDFIDCQQFSRVSIDFCWFSMIFTCFCCFQKLFVGLAWFSLVL